MHEWIHFSRTAVFVLQHTRDLTKPRPAPAKVCRWSGQPSRVALQPGRHLWMLDTEAEHGADTPGRRLTFVVKNEHLYPVGLAAVLGAAELHALDAAQGLGPALPDQDLHLGLVADVDPVAARVGIGADWITEGLGDL